MRVALVTVPIQAPRRSVTGSPCRAIGTRSSAIEKRTMAEVARGLSSHVGIAPDKKRLVRLHEAAESGIARREVQRPGELVAVEREAGLGAGGVARSQPDGHDAVVGARFEDRVPHRARRLRVHEYLVTDGFAGVARVSDLDVGAGEREGADVVHAHGRKRVPLVVGGDNPLQDAARLWPLEGEVEPRRIASRWAIEVHASRREPATAPPRRRRRPDRRRHSRPSATPSPWRRWPR